MTKNNKFLIILLTILNSVMLIKSNELLELVCSSDAQCKQFKHSGIISFCHYGHCMCSTTNGEMVQCKPLNYMVNNIVGGPCPCYLDYSECDHRQQVCYCGKGYVPSVDKRRCIKESLALNERCEEDYQCQSNDVNAVCGHDNYCLCKDRFINEEGKCASAIDLEYNCNIDSDCTKLFGSNTKCGSTTALCICTNNHYASVEHKTCLKSMKYLQACNETIQCIDALGIGGQCRDNLCQCREKYFADKKRSSTAYTQTVCTLFNVRGQTCRYDMDCYEHHLTEADQTMICNYGECNCKMGYHVNKHNECVPDKASAVLLSLVLIYVLGLIAIVNNWL